MRPAAPPSPGGIDRSRSAGARVVERGSFPLDETDDLLLPTQVGSREPSVGHAFPLRFVAPQHRGYDWVKWVSEAEVSSKPG